MQLTQRINQTQLQEKDPDAQNLLGRELGANPDALYIMAQTLLVQNMALEQLKAQVAQLQQQVQQGQQQPAHATSFLGRLFGEKDQPQQAAPQPQQTQPSQPQQQGWQPVPNYQQAPPPQYAQPQYAPPQFGQPQYVAVPAGQPSFLRGAMQTAAGVAAGALVFEGVESLMHGFGHGGGYGWGGPGMAGFGMGPGGGFGGGFERPMEETVINNYYDDPAQHGSGNSRVNDQLERDFGGEHHGHDDAQDAGQFAQADHDSSQFSGAAYSGSGANEYGGQFDQGAYDNGMENDTVAADNSVDNVQLDDSGSGFDDGGDATGFDDGGGFDNSGGDGF
jgi:hypothetical protein